jgi:hypothetical protein
MSAPVLPELDILDPMTHITSAKPQDAHPGCQQEQFTGPVPVRSERPMAEILAERLAEANPANPGPLFIP